MDDSRPRSSHVCAPDSRDGPITEFLPAWGSFRFTWRDAGRRDESSSTHTFLAVAGKANAERRKHALWLQIGTRCPKRVIAVSLLPGTMFTKGIPFAHWVELLTGCSRTVQLISIDQWVTKFKGDFDHSDSQMDLAGLGCPFLKHSTLVIYMDCDRGRRKGRGLTSWQSR
jgi:hypothetical protein